MPFEVGAHAGCRAEPAGRGDGLDGPVRRLQQFLGPAYSLTEQPVQWRSAEGAGEPSFQGTAGSSDTTTRTATRWAQAGQLLSSTLTAAAGTGGPSASAAARALPDTAPAAAPAIASSAPVSRPPAPSPLSASPPR